MNVGYREKFWHKNCFAIGLSAAFVEPLEASAIFLIEASGNMLAELFPRDKSSMKLVEEKVNKSFKFRWDKTIDFIKMHYYLSKRDEPFWQDNKKLNTVPDSLLESLARWKHQVVSTYDFDNVYEPFPLDSYQYVLYGMGFEQDLSFNKNSFNKQELAKVHYARVQEVTQKIQKQLPTNQELLKKVSQFGFQQL